MAVNQTFQERQPRMVRPKDIIFETGLGKTKVYELIATGELPSCKIGRAVLIPRDAFDKFLADRQAGIREKIAF